MHKASPERQNSLSLSLYRYLFNHVEWPVHSREGHPPVDPPNGSKLPGCPVPRWVRDWNKKELERTHKPLLSLWVLSHTCITESHTSVENQSLLHLAPQTKSPRDWKWLRTYCPLVLVLNTCIHILSALLVQWVCRYCIVLIGVCCLLWSRTLLCWE